MIDYIALVTGHALLAIAFWRLFLREDVDADPLIGDLRDSEAVRLAQTSISARNAARREASDVDHGDA